MRASELRPTLSKRGTVIMLQCEDYDHADKVYSWLEANANHIVDANKKPAPLQLREGAWYRRRDTLVVGPAKPSLSKVFPWLVGDGGYRDNGMYNESCFDSSRDLIAEVPPPVEPPIGSCVGHSMGPAMVEKPDADGWIAWTGGECPVDSDTMVEYRMRDGGKSKDKAVDLRWHHSRESDEFGSCMRPNDITHYRLVQPAPITHWVEVVGL